jgi:hypothetical protein
MISKLLNALIPPDQDLNMPGAGDLGLSHYLDQREAEAEIVKYINLLADEIKECKSVVMEQLTSEDLLELMITVKKRNLRLFHSVVSHVFRAYYSHAQILVRLNSGSVPPFPSGNFLREDDWTMLEPVFNRGQIYRNV